MTHPDDHWLLAHLADLELQAERGHKPCFSRFLDPRQICLFQQHMSPRLAFLLWGGYPDAERKMLGFFPAYMEPESSLFPLCALRLSATETLGHRDILGAAMGLKIQRNLLGDIAKEETGSVLFVQETVKDLLCMELTRIGRARVTLSEADLSSLSILPRAFVPLSGTVASLRLDCILGLLTGASRSRVEELIRQEAVSVNHSLCTKASCLLSVGDVLSVRGFGRAELLENNGTTKKGRIRIVLKKYI